MKARNPVSVLDIYKWLPGHGENAISVVFTDSDLIIEILYDSEKSDNDERIALTFSKTCCFSMSSFPGVDLIKIDYEKYDKISDLVEYTKSEPADKWSSQLSFYEKIRHYRIIFLSENKILEIFATGFKIVEK